MAAKRRSPLATRKSRSRRLHLDAEEVSRVTHIERAIVLRVLTAYYRARYRAARHSCEESGHTYGRRRTMTSAQLEQAIALRVEGVEWAGVAAELGVPQRTVQRSLRRYRREQQPWRLGLLERGSLRERKPTAD